MKINNKMNIFCTGNAQKDGFVNILINIIELNKSFDNNIFVDTSILEDKINNDKILGIDGIKFISYSEKRFDFVISIGGDGALLSTVRKMGDSEVPVLGIHIGNLGFLNQANKNNYKDIILEVLNKHKCKFSSHFLLSANIYSKNQLLGEMFALNDIVIKHSDMLRLIRLSIDLDAENLYNYACDGIIFSSPLGSTAYSLSAGGPIVSHGIKSLIITPISAHSLSARPIVIDSDKIINVKFPDNIDKISIVSDGQNQKIINSDCRIEIKQSKKDAKFIITNHMETYYSKLKTKIGFK